jgi:hypothetical protein
MEALMSLLPTHWYYNTESGELTQGNNLENLGNNLVGGAGWHELNISGSATEAQAAAEAQKEFPTGVTPTTSVTQGVENQAGAASFTDTAHALAAIYDKLTDGKMWRSLGWLALGVLLMITGVALLLKGSIATEIGSIAKAAV